MSERTVSEIIDEAIGACSERGRLDHYAAARFVREQVESLEAGGIGWAATARDNAEIDGWVKKVKARAKQVVIHLPKALGDRTVPSVYSRKREDGGRQLCLWLDLSVAELAELVNDIDDQASVLKGRVEIMRLGISLAEQHGVDTARAAFAAEGLSIEAVA